MYDHISLSSCFLCFGILVGEDSLPLLCIWDLLIRPMSPLSFFFLFFEITHATIYFPTNWLILDPGTTGSPLTRPYQGLADYLTFLYASVYFTITLIELCHLEKKLEVIKKSKKRCSHADSNPLWIVLQDRCRLLIVTYNNLSQLLVNCHVIQSIYVNPSQPFAHLSDDLVPLLCTGEIARILQLKSFGIIKFGIITRKVSCKQEEKPLDDLILQ